MITSTIAPTLIFTGKAIVVTPGSKITLGASQIIKSITIKALSTNTGIIYIGAITTSSTTGFQLSAGDSLSFDIANLNLVYIDASVASEGVSYFSTN